ncbi:MAG: tetratricopeptide repeat protein [bacterium]|nr:tetratricopeptide repeat protein [bacterium]
MRKISIFLIFFCMSGLPLNSLAENIPLPGGITMHDVGGKPVQGVQVVAADVSSPTISDTFGLFELLIAGKKFGDAVTLKALKAGLEVVNRMDMEVILQTDPAKRVKIVLCAEGERDQYALMYYKIRIERAIQANYAELKQLLTGKDAELAQLQEERDTALAQAEEVAKKFAELTLEDASGLYKQAFRLFQEGKIDAAIAVLDEAKIAAALQKARAEIKKGVDSYMLKAQLYVIKLQFEQAEALYQKAIDADPENFENLFEFALYLQKQNQFIKARPLYERALSLAETDSDVATTLNNLGILYKDLNQYPQATAAYQRALKTYEELAQTNPHTYLPDVAMTLNNLGGVYLALNQYEEMMAVLQRSLNIYEQLSETNPQAYLPYVATLSNNLAILHHSLEEYDEAVKLFKRTLEVREELAHDNSGRYDIEICQTLLGMSILYKTLLEKEPKPPYQEDGLMYVKRTITLLQKYPDLPIAQQYMAMAVQLKAYFESVSVK